MLITNLYIFKSHCFTVHFVSHDNNAVFINILNILGIEWQQLNKEVNEEIPDDGLKGSKHVGLFIKSVLSDFSVT